MVRLASLPPDVVRTGQASGMGRPKFSRVIWSGSGPPRTPAQVMLRWGIEHGLVVLPKSTHEARIRENAAIFDFSLDAEAMTALDRLDEGLVTGWDPRRQV